MNTPSAFSSRIPSPRLSVWRHGHASRVARGPRGRLLPVLLGLLLAMPASAKDTAVRRVRLVDPFDVQALRHDDETGYDTGDVRWRLRCDATQSLELRMHVSISPAGGSSGWRIADQDVTLPGQGSSPSRPLLSRQRGDGEPELPTLELECHGGHVHLMLGDVSVGVDSDPPDGGMRVAPTLPGHLKQWLSEPARSQIAEAYALQELFSLLRLPIEPETRAMAELHKRREAFAAGDWRGVGLEEPLKSDGQLSAELQERFQRFAQEVREARERTWPWRAVQPHRIGVLVGRADELKLPPRAETAFFWRGSSVCVPQTDTPEQMRCYDTVKGQWAKQEPRSGSSFTGDASEGPRGLELPFGAPLSDSWRAVSTTRRGYLLLEPRGLIEWTNENKSRRLSPEALRAELRRGPGSVLLEDGQYILGAWDRYSPIGHGDLRSWPLFEAPPPEHPGARWWHVLVSPDQRAVAATSCVDYNDTSCRLWVARLVPRPEAPQPPDSGDSKSL